MSPTLAAHKSVARYRLAFVIPNGIYVRDVLLGLTVQAGLPQKIAALGTDGRVLH